MSDAERSHAERVARMRQAAQRAEGPWAAKRELAAALRELLEHLPSTAASDAGAQCLVARDP